MLPAASSWTQALRSSKVRLASWLELIAPLTVIAPVRATRARELAEVATSKSCATVTVPPTRVVGLRNSALPSAGNEVPTKPT